VQRLGPLRGEGPVLPDPVDPVRAGPALEDDRAQVVTDQLHRVSAIVHGLPQGDDDHADLALHRFGDREGLLQQGAEPVPRPVLDLGPGRQVDGRVQVQRVLVVTVYRPRVVLE